MNEYVIAAGLPPGIAAPTLAGVLQSDVPQVIIAAWRDLAGEFSDTGDYMRGLTPQDSLLYPYLNDPDAVAVVNTAPHASWVEEGRAGFHLPSRWGSGKGIWHHGKNGPYAHVPFDHSTPAAKGGGTTRGRLRTAMPADVYKQALGLKPGARLSGFGDLYKQSKHYGLMAAQGMHLPQNLIDVGHYTWKASKFEGLFQSVVQSTERRPRHSKYMTIRTIKPDSPGWYIPPTPGRHLAQQAFDGVRSEVERLVGEAAAADLEAAIAAITGDFA